MTNYMICTYVLGVYLSNILLNVPITLNIGEKESKKCSEKL